jgi:hypothetical protein
MSVPGIVDSQFVSFPPNIDQRYLQQIETADGVTFDQLIARINGPVAAFNATIDPFVAELIAPPTTKVTVISRAPGRFEVVRRGDYDNARSQKPGKAYGHAIPIWANDAGLGFTEKGLRKMTADDITAEIEEALNGFRFIHRRDVLGRLFDNAEVPVDDMGTTTMLSPGFAGSGTGLNAFQAKFFPNMIEAVPNDYSHYWRVASGSLATGLKAMRDQHRKWYRTGKFDFVGSEAMTDAIVALGEGGGFIRAERAFIREGSANTVAQVDGDTYLGIFDDDVWVRKPIEDFTSMHGFLFQPLGALNPRNPLAWRYDPKAGNGAGKGVYVRSDSAWPLDQATLIQEGGIGVNNRVGAELLQVAESGDYAPPAGFTAG